MTSFQKNISTAKDFPIYRCISAITSQISLHDLKLVLLHDTSLMTSMLDNLPASNVLCLASVDLKNGVTTLCNTAIGQVMQMKVNFTNIYGICEEQHA